MVDRIDLVEANKLFDQYQQYAAALSLFDRNPRITAFTIDADPAEDVEGKIDGPVTVSAQGITSPPQMLTSIRDQVEQRMDEINKRLTELGVARS